MNGIALTQIQSVKIQFLLHIYLHSPFEQNQFIWFFLGFKWDAICKISRSLAILIICTIVHIYYCEELTICSSKFTQRQKYKKGKKLPSADNVAQWQFIQQ